MALNDYETQLSDADVERKLHREFVGGLWEELGDWQFRLMVERAGLEPDMKFLDLGCGCFRGGVKFLPFLQAGNYHGLDSNQSLVQAGLEHELPAHGLADRLDWSHIAVNSDFDVSMFGVQFDRVLALSVWTHLPLNHILFSLLQLQPWVKSGGEIWATIFEVPSIEDFWTPHQQKMGIVTYPHKDPYHYPFQVLSDSVEKFDLPYSIENMGDCGHPRGQVVLKLTRR